MRIWSDFPRAPIYAVAGLCIAGWVWSARAEGTVDPDAQSVLASMSKYLADLKSFSVRYSSVDEIVTADGQKLDFLHSGEIMVQRPDKLYAVRKSAAGTAEVFLNGKTITLFSQQANAYLQLAAPSIDAAIVVVHNLGFDAPGADLLASKPLDNSTTDMKSGAHIGMTFVDGTEANQLAFRGTDVDWQLWVMAGERPLPLRYVITTKTVSDAPEYTLQLSDWNPAPQIDSARFEFVPPQGAKKLDPASVTVDAIGDMTVKGE